MQCERIERLILLASSGEISPRQKRTMEAHMRECAACRSFDAAMETIGVAALPPDRHPSAAVLARIRALAVEVAARRRVYRPPIIQALAWAAALALIVGGWFVSVPDRQAARIGELRAILAAVSETPPALSETDSAVRPDERLRALADELLVLEGLGEDSGDSDVPPAVTPQSEPAPTALRPHSNDGLRARICV